MNGNEVSLLNQNLVKMMCYLMEVNKNSYYITIFYYIENIKKLLSYFDDEGYSCDKGITRNINKLYLHITNKLPTDKNMLDEYFTNVSNYNDNYQDIKDYKQYIEQSKNRDDKKEKIVEFQTKIDKAENDNANITLKSPFKKILPYESFDEIVTKLESNESNVQFQPLTSNESKFQSLTEENLNKHNTRTTKRILTIN